MYICILMRKLLLHTFAILLSSLMLVETVGIYITKDVCAPCGESEITAQLIITELNVNESEHACCEVISHVQECCAHETQCAHNEINHEHRQESHFYKNISVFLSTQHVPNFETQILTLMTPLLAIFAIGEKQATTHSEYNYKPKIPQDRVLSLLCTYLI